MWMASRVLLSEIEFLHFKMFEPSCTSFTDLHHALPLLWTELYTPAPHSHAEVLTSSVMTRGTFGRS